MQRLYTSVARQETNAPDISVSLDKINEISRIQTPEKPAALGESGGTGTNIDP